MAAERDTRDIILAEAQKLVQTRGFNAFSFRDVSERIGIKSASMHYHFPSKEQLGIELVRAYAARVRERLAEIEQRTTKPATRLERYIELFVEIMDGGQRLCLCGMLASDADTLPTDVRREVQAFFHENERWLASILDSGRSAGAFAFQGSPKLMARAAYALMQGALLGAHLFQEPERVKAAGKTVLALLSATPR
jgi:TetR/AcrR family transcriptional repressor of nem operon